MRVRTDHPTPRRVVPESTESLSQGREESRRGHHCQASPRRTDRLLESHGAGHRAARKTRRHASAQKSTADLGEGTVIAPGGKTQERFYANDPGLTRPSRSRREVNADFSGGIPGGHSALSWTDLHALQPTAHPGFLYPL